MISVNYFNRLVQEKNNIIVDSSLASKIPYGLIKTVWYYSRGLVHFLCFSCMVAGYLILMTDEPCKLSSPLASERFHLLCTPAVN